MKDFGDWFSNPTRRPMPAPPAELKPPLSDAPEADMLAAKDTLEALLPDGVCLRFEARCRGCGRVYELACSPAEFNSDTSYCGGSPRCLP